MSRRLVSLLVKMLPFVAHVARTKTVTTAQTPTLPQCIDLALKQNPSILEAHQEVCRSQGLVEARADTIPHLTASGAYAQVDPDAIDKFPVGGSGGTPTPVVFDNQEHPWLARSNEVQAPCVYNVAIAKLERATGNTVKMSS